MANISPSSQNSQHALTGGDPVNFATLGEVTVVVDETYDASDFAIVTPGPLGQEIVTVDNTDIMLTSAPTIIEDETNYFMQFKANLAVMVESATAYFLLQQEVTFDADLGLKDHVTPPAEIDLPLIALSAVNDSFTANDVTSTVTVDTFSIPVGELKSVKVVLNTTDPIGDPICCVN